MTDTTRLLAGRYEIGDLIGRGGMAEVHAGYDTRLGRDVAIKMLRSELARDRSFLMRFRREAQAAASLNHPSIVAVFDSGEDTMLESGGAESAVPFIVMEYVDGGTLRELLSENGPLDPYRACRIMAQVLRALDYSHAHGIIHRDVKPANVMIDTGDDAKVMDFGIARAVADTAATMTNTSVVIGTAQYLSPEQAQGQSIDARSDLYSAGCLLYELLTGRPPFVGDSPVAIAYQHVGEPPQPPSVHAPDVPAALDVVVLHALAKDPAERYQSGEQFADDLDAVLRREPTAAAALAVSRGELAPAPAAAESRTGATVMTLTDPDTEPRRRRWVVPLLLALLVLALVGLGIAAGQGLFSGEPEQVSVPELIGRTEAQAQQDLAALGLVPGRQAVANTAAAGTVVSQTPDAGAMVAADSTVQIGVSTGPQQKTVPDLRNFDQATARQKLDDTGLTIGQIKPVDSKDVAAGNVVSTEPKAGTEVAEGSPVTLNLSTGRVTVPNVTGNREETALTKLSEAGLGRSFNYVQGTQRPGTVIGQSYKEGEKVPVGTVIELTIVQSPLPTVTLSPSPAPPATTEPAPAPTTPPAPSPTGQSPTPTATTTTTARTDPDES